MNKRKAIRNAAIKWTRWDNKSIDTGIGFKVKVQFRFKLINLVFCFRTFDIFRFAKKKDKCTVNFILKYKRWMKSFTFWHFWADTKESVVDARDCRQWLIDPDFFAHFLANVLVFGEFVIRTLVCFVSIAFVFVCASFINDSIVLLYAMRSLNHRKINNSFNVKSRFIHNEYSLRFINHAKTFIYTYTKDLVERVFSIHFVFMKFVIIYPWNIRAYNVTWIIGHDFSEFFHWIEIMFQSNFGLSKWIKCFSD